MLPNSKEDWDSFTVRLKIREINSSLVLENADNVAVRRIELSTKELPKLNGFVELSEIDLMNSYLNGL